MGERAEALAHQFERMHDAFIATATPFPPATLVEHAMGAWEVR